MERLQLVSTKIPGDWVKRLNELTELTGLTQSALARKAIGQFLGIEQVDADSPVNLIRSELEQIKARLTALESIQLTESQPTAPKSKTSTPKPPTPPIAVVTKPTASPSKLMRSGELLIALQARGYKRSAGSLLRALNESIAMQAPNEELSRFGVKCDFEAKRSANPRSSNLRWLWIED